MFELGHSNIRLTNSKAWQFWVQWARERLIMISPDRNIDIEAALDRLMATIYEMSRESKKEWHTWRHIARRQEGSELLADYLASLASHPIAYGFFALSHNGQRVKLTEVGQRRASAGPLRLETETEKIAAVVKGYAGRLRQQVLNVDDIRPITKAGGRYIEAVSVQLEDAVIPTDTPVMFRPNEGPFVYGRLVGQESDGGTLYIAFDSEIRSYQLPGSLIVDRAFLLHHLAEAIRQLGQMPSASRALFEPLVSGLSLANKDSVDVAQMLFALKPPWSRYLWGPPGSGKTYALGRLALDLVRNSSGRILLVAPSNLAVDVALEQFLVQIKSAGADHLIKTRRVLRYGYPRKTSILEAEELLGPIEQSNLSREVSLISKRIKQAVREEASERDLAALRAALLGIQEELRTKVREHMAQCVLVAATTTMAFMQNSPLRELNWDTVLVDEVTMVPPVVCLYMSHLAQQRLLLAGDPRQLGPVYEESRQASQAEIDWLGRDVFDLGGISRGEGSARIIDVDDPRLARITSQRRSTDTIWRQVAYLYPQVANHVDEKRIAHLRESPPGPGKSLVLMDVSKASEARCEMVHKSWQNRYTADLALEVATTIAAEAAKNDVSVAIITPYRAQVKLLQQRLREEGQGLREHDLNITAGTIHQYQGSEADVVIFDMVDGPGRSRVGKLLRGDTGLRLVNVAITRARGKVIILFNRVWCHSMLAESDNPLLYRLVFGNDTQQLISVEPPNYATPAYPHTESPSEHMLLQAMRRIPELSSVQMQYRIYDDRGVIVSRADFAFPDEKFAVYADGANWHLVHDRWQRDLRQRNRLMQIGWRFFVFSRRQIIRDADECARQIARILYPGRIFAAPQVTSGSDTSVAAEFSTASYSANTVQRITAASVDEETLAALQPGLIIEIVDRAARSALNKFLYGRGFTSRVGTTSTDWRRGAVCYRVHHRGSETCPFRYGVERLPAG
ncbi:MAG: AAA family ATPase [Anaerolineales bacterium]|nr:AAA family ATPase [Anaerolineales bacterium]